MFDEKSQQHQLSLKFDSFMIVAYKWNYLVGSSHLSERIKVVGFFVSARIDSLRRNFLISLRRICGRNINDV